MNRNIFQNSHKLGQSDCCVCGSQNCFESLDHSKIVKQDLRRIFTRFMQSSEPIMNFKHHINQIYINLRRIMIQQIDHLHKKSLEWLNRFVFQGIQKQKMNVDILSQLMEENYSSLPYKPLQKLMAKVQRYHCTQSNSQSQIFSNVKFHFQQYIQRFKQNQLRAKVRQFCFIPQYSALEWQPKLKAKRSSLQNPQQVVPLPSYRWRNVLINTHTKTASLSNKDITDHDMSLQISAISVYKNLEELQIRYNRITPVTCSLIASNLHFLTAVDIRGNKVGDQGIVKIVKGIFNLKSLMLSETGITDITGNQIQFGLPFLQLLWSQNTFLTAKHVLGISKKPKLKVLCLTGNQIQTYFIGEIRKNFGNKGYLSI